MGECSLNESKVYKRSSSGPFKCMEESAYGRKTRFFVSTAQRITLYLYSIKVRTCNLKVKEHTWIGI